MPTGSQETGSLMQLQGPPLPVLTGKTKQASCIASMSRGHTPQHREEDPQQVLGHTGLALCSSFPEESPAPLCILWSQGRTLLLSLPFYSFLTPSSVLILGLFPEKQTYLLSIKFCLFLVCLFTKASLA